MNKSCDVCASRCTYRAATQRITRGGELVWVCDEHVHAQASSIDFGQAKSNGTRTSAEAARMADKLVAPQGLMVLGYLAVRGGQGAIREEICKATGITNQAACARLNALEQLGLVRVDGDARLADTNRNQQIYRIVA